MIKHYFYFSEVSIVGKAGTPVWIGNGVCESNETPTKVLSLIEKELLKHVSNVTSLPEKELRVITKQLNLV